MNPYTNNQTNITWVQGIETAKAYQLPSNSSALLMDNENDGVFYIKVSDNIGMLWQISEKSYQLLQMAQLSL